MACVILLLCPFLTRDRTGYGLRVLQVFLHIHHGLFQDFFWIFRFTHHVIDIRP